MVMVLVVMGLIEEADVDASVAAVEAEVVVLEGGYEASLEAD